MPWLRAAADPAVRLSDEARERLAEGLDLGGAAVGRSVVHDDQFERLQRLGEHRTYGAATSRSLL